MNSITINSFEPTWNLSRYTITFIALGIAILAYILPMVFGFDLFHLVAEQVSHLRLEGYEVNALIIPLVIIAVGQGFDFIRLWIDKKRQQELNAQRLKAMRATMATVDDLVNNLLNNLVYVRYRAEQCDVFGPKLAKDLDDQIKMTMEKLHKLKNIETIVDRHLGDGIITIDAD